MRYVSNLTAPDLRPVFKLANPMPQKMGHDCPSDPDFEPECTYLTDDEAAILCAIAAQPACRGIWVDIGARFGWTAKHINWATNREVYCVDPHFAVRERHHRFLENVGFSWPSPWIWPGTSENFFATMSPSERGTIRAAMIDGNHDAPEPTNDAIRAMYAGAQVLVFHDFAGKPIRDAVNWLLGDFAFTDSNGDRHIQVPGGWNARIYWTPNLMAVAWRDGCGFTPPDHVRDPRADWSGMERIVAEDFDVRRCE